MKLRFIIQIGNGEGYQEVPVEEVQRIAGNYITTTTKTYHVWRGDIEFVKQYEPLDTKPKWVAQWEYH